MDTPFALILGATGRLAGMLRRAWAEISPPLPVRWAARRPLDGAIAVDPLTDPAALARAAEGAAVVLDLSGRTTGTEAELAVNAALARATLAAAAGRPVLLASSAAVYGPLEVPGTEAMPPAPVSDYGRAKAAVETLAEGHPRATCLRIGNVAGADALLGPAPRTGIVLDQWPDGATPFRSYLGPRGFADVITTLLAHAAAGRPLPRRLNVTAPTPVTMGALLDAAGLPWSPHPAGPAAIRAVTLDATALAALHPFRGDEGAAATIAAEWRTLTGAP